MHKQSLCLDCLTLKHEGARVLQNVTNTCSTSLCHITEDFYPQPQSRDSLKSCNIYLDLNQSTSSCNLIIQYSKGEKLCNVSYITVFIQKPKFEALVMLCKVRWHGVCVSCKFILFTHKMIRHKIMSQIHVWDIFQLLN